MHAGKTMMGGGSVQELVKQMDRPYRSSDRVERQLIKSILEAEYPAGSPLPSERELANRLGVGRPIVREVIQRLERDGWLEVRKGQPAIVKDFWQHGTLNTLVNIVRNSEKITGEIITHLLELRISLTPAYVRDAVANQRPKVVSLLSTLDQLENHADAFAAFDWHLQKSLASLSPNPIYVLILNSFEQVYLKMARLYFAEPARREASRRYYHDLLEAALAQEATFVEQLARAMMAQSLEEWQNAMAGERR